MDWIRIEELEVWLRVGVPEEERARPQRLWITVEMGGDVSAAASADDLAQTIDYHAVARRILGLGEGRSWRLIETLASEVAEIVLGEFGARSVRVEVKKFILAETRYVSVKIQRGLGEGG